MIDLRDLAAPASVQPSLLDFGGILRPATGAAILRIDRLGNRYQAAVSWAPMKGETARIIISRLTAGKREGIRIGFPLQRVDQGYPGNAVVDGAGQAGTTLVLRGLVPNYAAKEGYWFSVEDASGQHYLHNVRASSRADLNGDMTLAIEPMLRTPFVDGAAVHLSRPAIEGLITSDISWSMTPGGICEGISCTIEEAA